MSLNSEVSPLKHLSLGIIHCALTSIAVLGQSGPNKIDHSPTDSGTKTGVSYSWALGGSLLIS